MTAPVPLVERLAEHEWLHGIGKCLCGWEPTYPESMGPGDTEVEMTQHRAHVARALLPVVEQAVAEARGEALREAAEFISDTSGIGEAVDGFGQGWYGALDYALGELRDRADAIATTEGA